MQARGGWVWGFRHPHTRFPSSEVRFDKTNHHLRRLLPHTPPDLLWRAVGSIVILPVVPPGAGLHVVRGIRVGVGGCGPLVRVVPLRHDLVGATGRVVVEALLGAGRGMLLELLGLLLGPGLRALATTTPAV